MGVCFGGIVPVRRLPLVRERVSIYTLSTEHFAILQHEGFYMSARCYCKVLTVPNEPFHLTVSTSGLASLNSIDGGVGRTNEFLFRIFICLN